MTLYLKLMRWCKVYLKIKTYGIFRIYKVSIFIIEALASIIKILREFNNKNSKRKIIKLCNFYQYFVYYNIYMTTIDYIDYTDYKKKYLKYKTKYFKLKGGLVGINIDDYNRLNDKPAIFDELYNLNIQFNNDLSNIYNHWNISTVPTDDNKLIPKMNPDNTVNKTYQKDDVEYFYNHVLINNIFRYAFEPGYTNLGNTDFGILKNTFKSINKIYLLDYQNIVGQMHKYRNKKKTEINNQFQNINNIIPLLTDLKSISNQILDILPIIQNMNGNILINQCRAKLSSYKIAYNNIPKIVELIDEINTINGKLENLSTFPSKILKHEEGLQKENNNFKEIENQYRAKQMEQRLSVDKYQEIKARGIPNEMEQAKQYSFNLQKEERILEKQRDNQLEKLKKVEEYISHLKREMGTSDNLRIRMNDLQEQLNNLKATLISPPQAININDNNILLSSQEILKNYYFEKIKNINDLIQYIIQYRQKLQDIQIILNNTNQYIVTNLNIDFDSDKCTITELLDILRNINNYITFLVTDNKLLNRKNKFNSDYRDDTYASACEVAFTIIRHNIDALSSGRKNLYILCGHQHPNFNSNIENDINDALKIFYNCFSRSTFGEFDITNIVSIQSEFKKSRAGIYFDSNGFDDFMFWILGISISSFIHGCFENNPENSVIYIQPDGMRNLNDIINTSNTKIIPPRLILLTNDTQKLNDKTKDGIKNLYSELVLLYEKINLQTGEFKYKIYVNGYENKYLNICLYDLLTELVDPQNFHNLPDKFTEHSRTKLNLCVENRPDSNLNLGSKTPQNTNINNLANNIKEFISNCTHFEKFMVFVKYLQQIYFGAIDEYAMTLNTIEKFFTNINL